MGEQQARSRYASQAEYWNSAASRPWADQHQRQDRALAGLAKAALELAGPQQGETVLDIGCGSGTVLELAARVGAAGHVLGADISGDPWRGRARRIAAAGLRHAE
jgi:cyclopropane fatty-acyl-phospholipid synthase-like methyltransferase